MLLYIFICCVLFIVIFFNLIFSPFSYFSFYLVVCLVHALSCVICYQIIFFGFILFIYLFIYLFYFFVFSFQDICGALKVTAVSSGYCLGSCNWLICSDHEKVR